MAFSASGAFGLNLKDIFDNLTAIDWVTDALIKCALFTNTLTTPNYDTNTAYGAAPWNANEVTGTGYTAGGPNLTTRTLGVASTILKFDADDASWAGATISSIRGALIWDDTITTPTADPGLFGITFGADFAVTAGTLTVVWNAAGIATLDYA